MPTVAKSAIRTTFAVMALAAAAACGSAHEAGPYEGAPDDDNLGFVGSGGRGFGRDGGAGGKDSGDDSGKGTTVTRLDAGGVESGTGGSPGDGGKGSLGEAGGAEGGGGNVPDGGSGVGVKFNLPPGFFPSLDWVVSGPGGHYSGTVTFGNAQSIEFVIGGIEAASGYVLEISGTDVDGDRCSGASAPFAIVAGEVAGAGIVLTCAPGLSDAAGPANVTTGSVGVDAGVMFRDL
jgi:hypothetical protein